MTEQRPTAKDEDHPRTMLALSNILALLYPVLKVDRTIYDGRCQHFITGVTRRKHFILALRE